METEISNRVDIPSGSAESKGNAPRGSEDWLDNAVMVTGLGYSGTTLLLNLLDGSDEMLVYPAEPSFPVMSKCRYGYEDIRHLGRDWLFGTPNAIHLNSVVKDLPGYPEGYRAGKGPRIPADFVPDPVALKERCSRVRLPGVSETDQSDVIDLEGYLHDLIDLVYHGSYDSEVELIRASITLLKQRSRMSNLPVRSWCFKWPEAIGLSVPSIDQFLAEFPKGKVVLLIRSAEGHFNSHKAVVEGKLGRHMSLPMRLSFALDLSANLQEAYWALYRVLPERLGARGCVVEYEKLCADPETEMRRLCEFLELPATEQLFQPTAFGRTAATPTNRTGGDGRKVSTASVDKWKKQLSWWEKMIVAGAMRDVADFRSHRAAWLTKFCLGALWGVYFNLQACRKGVPYHLATKTGVGGGGLLTR